VSSDGVVVRLDWTGWHVRCCLWALDNYSSPQGDSGIPPEIRDRLHEQLEPIVSGPGALNDGEWTTLTLSATSHQLDALERHLGWTINYCVERVNRARYNEPAVDSYVDESTRLQGLCAALSDIVAYRTGTVLVERLGTQPESFPPGWMS
jgi:hypothetical protein